MAVGAAGGQGGGAGASRRQSVAFQARGAPEPRRPGGRRTSVMPGLREQPPGRRASLLNMGGAPSAIMEEEESEESAAPKVKRQSREGKTLTRETRLSRSGGARPVETEDASAQTDASVEESRLQEALHETDDLKILNQVQAQELAIMKERYGKLLAEAQSSPTKSEAAEELPIQESAPRRLAKKMELRRLEEQVQSLRMENSALKLKMDNMIKWSVGDWSQDAGSDMHSPRHSLQTPMTPRDHLTGDDWVELAQENRKMRMANSLLLEQLEELRSRAERLGRQAQEWSAKADVLHLPVLPPARLDRSSHSRRTAWFRDVPDDKQSRLPSSVLGPDAAAAPAPQMYHPRQAPQKAALSRAAQERAGARGDQGWRRQHFSGGIRDTYYSPLQKQKLQGERDRKGRPRLPWSEEPLPNSAAL